MGVAPCSASVRWPSYCPSATWMWNRVSAASATSQPARIIAGEAPCGLCGAGWTVTSGSPACAAISSRTRRAASAGVSR